MFSVSKRNFQGLIESLLEEHKSEMISKHCIYQAHFIKFSICNSYITKAINLK